MLDALSHPARLQIFEHLSKHPECPAWAISDALPICKSTVLQHMAKLKEVGVIVCNPFGVCQNYQLNRQWINDLKQLLCEFLYRISDD